MKRKIITALLLASSVFASAQSEVDALRYSMIQRPGTARSFGMGSSFGALGSDLSSFFGNPAGIGAYKRGGVEISLGLNNQLNNVYYGGQSAENSSTHLTLNNFGIVGSRKPKNSDWVSVNFGIAYAKNNIFYDKISIRGTEFNTTLMDVFAAQAAGINPDAVTTDLPFTSGLAYQVYAIDPVNGGEYYVPAASGGEVRQSKIITRKGAQSETSFGFGANFRDFLMFGGALQFQSLRFTENSVYSESFDSDEPLKNLSFNEDLQSDGTGIGIKVGFLLKPTEWVRVGAAYHSRTVMGIRETYTSSMGSRTATDTTWSYTSPLLITNYNLSTPNRYIVNTAFILGKAGVISADYEFADYDNMRMRSTGNNDYDYNVENKTIGMIYRGTHRVSAGMEWRLLREFYVRGGAIYQQSPFVNGVAINNPWITYTGGLGYRNDYFFIDLAGGYYKKDETYYIYQTSETQPATINTARLNLLMSLGFRY